MVRPAASVHEYFMFSRRASRAIWLVLALMAGCGSEDEHDWQKDVYMGKAARDRILKPGNPAVADPDGKPLPPTATNFYYYDGGSFNGTILYWSFDCATVEDCWAALSSVRGPDRSKFKEWEPSKFAVVMNGPEFYSPKLATKLWDVRAIKSGLVYEFVEDGNRRMKYYAVDLDRLRVYHHYKGGGFPEAKYEGAE